MDEDNISSQLTGVAGVHFVASFLSYSGFHAVPTTRNVKGPDLLVSNLDGSKSISIQVKTTRYAMRTRGRGVAKKEHHCEWDIGWSSAKINHPSVFFALVDLKNYEKVLPDVYIIPSRIIHAYFSKGNPDTWRRARYHPLISEISEYKNKWDIFSAALENEK